MGTRSILAIELCLHFDAKLQAFLQDLMKRAPARQSLHDQWQLYDHAGRALIANRSLWAKGCWDFFDEDARARADFNMWVHGMVSREGARQAPAPQGDPYRTGPRFMTFTIAALLVNGSASERALARTCDIPEAHLWHAATFERILLGLRHLNFASVEGSTLYLIPRDAPYTLTQEDLSHPKFEYLRPIL